MTNRIREERKKLKITQAELADRVQISRQSIIAIESGKYIPSTILALKIAVVFDLSVADLFKLESGD